MIFLFVYHCDTDVVDCVAHLLRELIASTGHLLKLHFTLFTSTVVSYYVKVETRVNWRSLLTRRKKEINDDVV